mmetsp:Transcript_18127/g.68506  ORF Transcript_18127/g.68506 Transcript_18127/m.68506 type:complete len:269 (+) Transcript_18127:957-1763(+)
MPGRWRTTLRLPSGLQLKPTPTRTPTQTRTPTLTRAMPETTGRVPGSIPLPPPLGQAGKFRGTAGAPVPLARVAELSAATHALARQLPTAPRRPATATALSAPPWPCETALRRQSATSSHPAFAPCSAPLWQATPRRQRPPAAPRRHRLPPPRTRWPATLRPRWGRQVSPGRPPCRRPRPTPPSRLRPAAGRRLSATLGRALPGLRPGQGLPRAWPAARARPLKLPPFWPRRRLVSGVTSRAILGPPLSREQSLPSSRAACEEMRRPR